ncbi:MAG: hypothetical protein EOO01_00020 [Chitinophagaceae bacterium]|nr:MAG: hypothetical protein EOO01_00020 [Chitinophagaceae bacterium]
MSKNKVNGINAATVIFCIISVVGIFYLILRWKLNRKLRKKVREMLPSLQAVLGVYNGLTDYTNYFSNFQAGIFLAKAKPLYARLPFAVSSIGLKDDELAVITKLDEIIRTLPDLRSAYNDEFVPKEIEKYGGFFAGLEKYPLSLEQMEAVVRDEDNNLVVAGAGTGKTTTVSAKVAYLLEKGLAESEDLLIISFTRSAVGEMFDRCVKFCNRDFAEGELEVKTFNAFGYLVNRTCSKTGLRLAFDGDDKRAIEFLEKSFSDLFLSDKDFERLATNYIAFFNRPYRSEFSFSSGDEQIKYEKSFPNIALNGVHLKSGQEVQIANFLFLNSIEFEYEKFFPLELNDRDPKRGDYCPDFYFPEHDIWLEHFGIDENGDVPSFFKTKPPFATAKDYYHDGMLWKEGIHAKYNTKFIKSYSFESKNGRLLANLKHKLEGLGVELVPRAKEEIFEAIQKSPEFDGLIKLIHTFLGLMKSNNRNPGQFAAEAKKDMRFKVFLDVFSRVYQLYESRIAKDSALDYNDMVNRATTLIGSGEYVKKYKYILVDEFQDMSIGRYELLRSLLLASPGCKLYAVGDDWQSIFRFTGSDISIMTDFTKQFGHSYRSKIAKTYRFNSEILQATSTFVQQNPAQIQKELQSDMVPLEPSFAFIPLNFSGTVRELRGMVKWEKVDEILSVLGAKGENLEVYLIGRYHHNRPDDLRELDKRHPNITLSYFTAHSVKGLTCDYAIVLDVDSGQFGFPSEVADDQILNYLLHEGDSYENAEERRLFYVALTRAKHKVFLLYDKLAPSKFLPELMEEKDALLLEEGKRCPECSGAMVAKQIRSRNFMACSNYPHCKVLIPQMVS